MEKNEGCNVELVEQISKLARLMRRRTADGKSVPHAGHRILSAVLSHDGIHANELAEAVGIRPSSLTDALDALEKKGLILREKDENDIRAVWIRATQKTQERRNEWKAERDSLNSRLLACLTEDEIKSFTLVCEKLYSCFENERLRDETRENREDSLHGHKKTGDSL